MHSLYRISTGNETKKVKTFFLCFFFFLFFINTHVHSVSRIPLYLYNTSTQSLSLCSQYTFNSFVFHYLFILPIFSSSMVFLSTIFRFLFYVPVGKYDTRFPAPGLVDLFRLFSSFSFENSINAVFFPVRESFGSRSIFRRVSARETSLRGRGIYGDVGIRGNRHFIVKWGRKNVFYLGRLKKLKKVETSQLENQFEIIWL